jgi:hypothetical protein
MQKGDQARRITAIFIAAQGCLVLNSLIRFVVLHWLPVDFLSGLLVGFSIVGNLAYLVYYGKNKRQNAGLE